MILLEYLMYLLFEFRLVGIIKSSRNINQSMNKSIIHPFLFIYIKRTEKHIFYFMIYRYLIVIIHDLLISVFFTIKME